VQCAWVINHIRKVKYRISGTRSQWSSGSMPDHGAQGPEIE